MKNERNANKTGGRKHETRAFVIAASLVTAVFATGIATADAPGAHEVTIDNITAIGSGCTEGSVASLLSSDQQAFTLFFSDFIATAGPDEPIASQYKTCNIQLALNHPRNWQFAVLGVDYRGYAALDRSATATLRTQYWLQGVFNNPVQFRRDIRGPFSDEYLEGDYLAESELVWSPCDVKRALNLKASIAVRAFGRSQGLMTVDSIDGEVKQTYKIKWRRCSGDATRDQVVFR